MNLGLKSIVSGIFTSFSQFHKVPVRYRYYAEKIARGPIAKKYGYNDPLFQNGILPRLKNAKRLPVPLYKPKNAWSEERATFGQNDYIDILGGGRLKPHNICYNVPKWLRGRKGNEYQLLTLKQRILSHTKYEEDYPKTWENLNKRIRHLYKYLNRKTKTSFMRN